MSKKLIRMNPAFFESPNEYEISPETLDKIVQTQDSAGRMRTPTSWGKIKSMTEVKLETLVPFWFKFNTQLHLQLTIGEYCHPEDRECLNPDYVNVPVTSDNPVECLSNFRALQPISAATTAPAESDLIGHEQPPAEPDDVQDSVPAQIDAQVGAEALVEVEGEREAEVGTDASIEEHSPGIRQHQEVAGSRDPAPIYPWRKWTLLSASSVIVACFIWTVLTLDRSGSATNSIASGDDISPQDSGPVVSESADIPLRSDYPQSQLSGYENLALIFQSSPEPLKVREIPLLE